MPPWGLVLKGWPAGGLENLPKWARANYINEKVGPSLGLMVYEVKAGRSGSGESENALIKTF
jgi:hypothetical protein